MKYGYVRVSTRQQGTQGNSLESQTEAVRDAGAEAVYTDIYTGKTLERPEFDKLMGVIQSGDTLIVTRLDRFARSISQASDLITELIDRGITVNVLTVGVLSNDSVSVLLRNVLLSFAQFERDMIVERTQEGKAVARQREGYREGRPRKYSQAQIAHALELLGDHSYTQVEEMTGISKSTLIRARKCTSKPEALGPEYFI